MQRGFSAVVVYLLFLVAKNRAHLRPHVALLGSRDRQNGNSSGKAAHAGIDEINDADNVRRPLLLILLSITNGGKRGEKRCLGDGKEGRTEAKGGAAGSRSGDGGEDSGSLGGKARGVVGVGGGGVARVEGFIIVGGGSSRNGVVVAEIAVHLGEHVRLLHRGRGLEWSDSHGGGKEGHIHKGCGRDGIQKCVSGEGSTDSGLNGGVGGGGGSAAEAADGAHRSTDGTAPLLLLRCGRRRIGAADEGAIH